MGSAGKVMKVLISCSTGKISVLLARVSKLNKSGTFGALFLLGGFPGGLPTELTQSPLPIDIYLFGHTVSTETKIPEKLHLLSSAGLTTIGSLSITYYMGENLDDSTVGTKRQRESDSDFSDLKAKLRERTTPCDVLITRTWPTKILNHLSPANYPLDLQNEKTNTPSVTSIGCEKVQQLVQFSTPRYHFTTAQRRAHVTQVPESENVFFQRIPFKQEAPTKESNPVLHPCRFLSLPSIDTKGHKWLYASNIAPLDELTPEQLGALPAHTTESPFTIQTDAAAHLNTSNQLKVHSAYGAFGSLADDTPAMSRWDMSDESSRDRNRKRKRSGPTPIDKCWFCMDQDPAEHLIVSIGDESYLALPKGGMTPDHVLIIPLDHVTHPSAISEATQAEILKFKKALKDHAASKNKEMVFYERNAETKHGMVHCIIQCIPMKREDDLSAKVRKSFEDVLAVDTTLPSR